MHMTDECQECIMRRARGILERKRQSRPEELLVELANQMAELKERPDLSWVSGGFCPAQFGTLRQEFFRSKGIGDSYQEEKRLGLEIGMKVFEQYRGEKYSLEEAILATLIGNAMEFDVGGIYKSADILESEMMRNMQEIKTDKNPLKRAVAGLDLENLHQSLLQHHTILYFVDNVGEHYFDLFLIRKLQEIGKKVSIVVKGAPVLNDVTRREMEHYPLDIEILDTGNGDIGMFVKRIPDTLKKRIDATDLLIIKGMANFETLSREQFDPAQLYLFKAKCDPVALATGVTKGDYVVRYVQAGKSLLS